MGFIETLEWFDRQLLLELNAHVGNSALDSFMVLISEKWLWIPLYAFLLIALWKKFGHQNVFWIMLGVFALVVITDQGSVHFFKEIFQRDRPCHEADLAVKIVSVTGKCGGKYGFISSHAANVFGLASVLFILFKSTSKYWALLFLWAALVAFSRVYLAVHYPFDVLVGGFYGMICGTLIGILENGILKVR